MVGMSGGVDSAVAALVLVNQGYAVEGMFMKNWEDDDGTEYCTAEADYADALAVCEMLGIPLHAANFAAEYWDNVFEHFLAEYRAGRTPNPDVLCNREIKFNLFLDYARQLGADVIATGHYVRRVGHGDTFRLLKGLDRGKDQSYFLNAVPQEQLQPCWFPIGAMRKTEVRARARQAGLHVHDKKDSTGICFIGERRFSDFLARYVPKTSGPIVDAAAVVLGEHTGLPYYTLGQRQGLGIGGQAGRAEAPWYVAEKRLDTNELVVTQDETDLESIELRAERLNLLAPVEFPLRCAAKTRYRQADQPCAVTQHGESLHVTFDHGQRAVTPGQYVCLYDADVCLGGAVIAEVVR
jgi:tRNA-specific 2-thiouridylase